EYVRSADVRVVVLPGEKLSRAAAVADEGPSDVDLDELGEDGEAAADGEPGEAGDGAAEEARRRRRRRGGRGRGRGLGREEGSVTEGARPIAAGADVEAEAEDED